MKNKLSKIDIYDFLSMFFIIVGNYLIYSTLGKVVKIIICTLLIVTGSIMTLISVIKKYKNNEYTPKQIKIVTIIGITAMLVWHRPAEIYVSTLLALKYIKEDLRKMIKNIFFSSVLSYGIIVLMWLVGVTIGVIGYRGDILRYGIGFNHPNVALRFLVPIILSGAIMSKNNKVYLVISLIASALGFLVTNSRGGCLAIIIFCVLSLLPKSFKRKMCNMKAIPYMFLGGVIFSLIVALYLNNITFLNQALSARPEIWKVYIDNLEFFGQVYQVHQYPLDNVFLHTLYYGGVYGLIFFLIIYFVAFRNNDIKNNYNIVILFASVFVYGLVENYSNQGESFYLLLVMIQLLDYTKLKELDDDYKEEVKKKEVEFLEEQI